MPGTPRNPRRGSLGGGRLIDLALVLGASIALAITFRGGLTYMAAFWHEPEYSHGYLIPFLAVYLGAIRLAVLREVPRQESWAGVALVIVGLLGFIFGELSALYIIVEYSFLLTLWGVVLTAMGWRATRVIWVALVFLLFMVPLPRFIQWNLSNELQLISTDMGAWMLRLLGIPVFVEGNVIDLGAFKLQVVEACSGLRYLFPLMSFACMCAVLFRGAFWQRAIIFLSSVPISIVMNSVRIAVTGILVNAYGTEMAEGFLHYFEGWVIFTASLALMFLGMGLLALLGRRRLAEVFDVDLPTLADVRGFLPLRPAGAPLLAAAVLLVGAAVVSVGVPDRQEAIPARTPLRAFPRVLGDWSGRDETLSQQVLAELQLTDYLTVNYQRPEEQVPVALYVAWYDSQRKGASVHSPKACLPGGGWQIENFSQVRIAGVRPDGGDLPVNRVVIAMGEQRMLVYYWFTQRGRLLTNEYLVKWYIFWDSITKNRTDGALVRLTTPVGDAAQLEAADQRLQAFVRAAEPKLYYFIPQDKAPPAVSQPGVGVGVGAATGN